MPPTAQATPAPIHDIAGPVWFFPYPAWMAVAAGLAFLVLVGLLFWFTRRKRPAPCSARVSGARGVAELRRRASEADPYGFGVRVSDALRTYIRDQHGLDAVTRTSVEFLEVLRDNAAFTNNEKAAISRSSSSPLICSSMRGCCGRGRDSNSPRDRRARRARREPAANCCFQMTEGSPFGFSFATSPGFCFSPLAADPGGLERSCWRHGGSDVFHHFGVVFARPPAAIARRGAPCFAHASGARPA